MAVIQRIIEVLVAGRRITFPAIDINFNIKFDSEDEPNVSEIVLYNLAEDTRNGIRKGQPIIVNAGYNNDVGAVFVGVVYDVVSTKDVVDRVTRVSCIDVTPQFTTQQVSVSYSSGTTATFIITDILRQIGLSPEVLDIQEYTFNNGFSFRGRVIDALKKMATYTQSRVAIRNSNIFFLRTNGIQSGEVFSTNTGLLDIEKIDKNNTLAQWRVRSTLKHSISSGSIIEIRSEPFNGLAVVQQGQHNKNFETVVEVVPL